MASVRLPRGIFTGMNEHSGENQHYLSYTYPTLPLSALYLFLSSRSNSKKARPTPKTVSTWANCPGSPGASRRSSRKRSLAPWRPCIELETRQGCLIATSLTVIPEAEGLECYLGKGGLLLEERWSRHLCAPKITRSFNKPDTNQRALLVFWPL